MEFGGSKMLRTQEETEKICENCRFSKRVSGLAEPTLICENKAGACEKCLVVKDNASCSNFKFSRDIVPADIAEAFAEGARLIPLTQDKFAIVDAEDYEELSKHKWHTNKSHKSEYAARKPGRKHISMHRLLLNAPPGLLVDHRDGNGLNNRKSNLRLCTHQENTYNQRPRRGGTSRFKGVYWHKTEKKYTARIRKNGKRYSLGYFHDEIEAAVAYGIKAMEFFGEFAYLNFPKLMQRYKICNTAA
jgi:hypothetical protein